MLSTVRYHKTDSGIPSLISINDNVVVELPLEVGVIFAKAHDGH